MRLIDADALKEKIENLIGYSLSYEAILNTIDNAPTVETHDTVNMYCDKNTQITIEQIRPKGEWIYDSDHSITIDMYRCSVCGYFGHTHFKFCPDCGANMGGVLK